MRARFLLRSPRCAVHGELASGTSAAKSFSQRFHQIPAIHSMSVAWCGARPSIASSKFSQICPLRGSSALALSSHSWDLARVTQKFSLFHTKCTATYGASGREYTRPASQRLDHPLWQCEWRESRRHRRTTSNVLPWALKLTKFATLEHTSASLK